MSLSKVKVLDKEFEIYISRQKIEESVKRVADQMNAEIVDEKPLFIVVLNGAFMFASDLIKQIDFECEISFVKLSSYVGTQSTHAVKSLIGLNENLKGRNLIIVEDIIDTGITMEHILEQLDALKPASVRIATMLFKPKAFTKNFTIDYVGLEIGNDFIIGYGLDYDGFARNLPDIYKIT